MIEVSHAVADPNLLVVGGAYWSERHDLARTQPGTTRELSASQVAIGYDLPATAAAEGIRVPQICGLCGPAFAQPARITAGGLSVLPVVQADAQSKLIDVLVTASATSYAAPQVCGIAALVLERQGARLGPTVLRRRLLDTANDLPQPGAAAPGRAFSRPSGTNDILALPNPADRPGLADLAGAVTASWANTTISIHRELAPTLTRVADAFALARKNAGGPP